MRRELVALDVDASMDAAQDNRGGISRLRIRRRRRKARCVSINAREIPVPRCLCFVMATFQSAKSNEIEPGHVRATQ